MIQKCKDIFINSINLKIITKFYNFIGKKSFKWFTIGLISSIALSIVEFLFAISIQFLLVSLGFISSSVTILGFTFPKISITSVVLMLLFIGLLRFISQLLNIHSMTYMYEYFNCRIKNLSIYDLIFNSSSKTVSSSDVNYRSTELAPKVSIFMSGSLSLLSTIIQCSILLVFLFLTEWKESLISLIGILIIATIVINNNKKIRSLSSKIPNEQEQLNKGIEKTSRNILFINIMKTNDQEYNSLTKNSLNYSSNLIRVSFLNNLNTVGTPFLGIILLVAIIFISQEFWLTNSNSLVSFLYILVRFIQNLSQVANGFGALNISYPQFKQAFNYYNEFSKENKIKATQPSNYLKFVGSKDKFNINFNFSQKHSSHLESINLKQAPDIKFESVSFYYDTINNRILNNFNLEVESGEQLGIVGTSGSGKTTLLMLLLGILQPKKGKIKVGGRTPEIYFSDNSVKVGYVGPEPFLINGSLRDNIIYGIKATCSEEKIWNALELVSLKKDFEEKSLDYEISENLSGLSAGQKQRLCIARAILNEPQILILDEPTANLDEITEREVCDSIARLKKKCTTVIVSHRSGVLKNIDKIIEVSAL